MSDQSAAPPPRGASREVHRDWAEARRRLDQVRAAGYRAEATDAGDCGVIVTIWRGKHPDLARLPRPR